MDKEFELCPKCNKFNWAFGISEKELVETGICECGE